MIIKNFVSLNKITWKLIADTIQSVNDYWTTSIWSDENDAFSRKMLIDLVSRYHITFKP